MAIAVALALPACGGSGNDSPTPAAPVPYVPWTIQNPANVPISMAADDQEVPHLIADGSGGAFIAWSDVIKGVFTDIHVQRVDSLGAIQWTVNGVSVSTASGIRRAPSLALDGAGGVIVTWEDFRNATDFDIYAQRLNSAGLAQWAPDGVAICTQSGHQFSPKVVADRIGGAIIIWSDHRNSPSSDVYAQRVNAAGVVQWAADGIAAAPGGDGPEIIGTGNGECIIAYFGGVGQISAQRLNGAGAPLWGASGVPVCTVGGPLYLQMTTDEAGGAILAWSDERVGNVKLDIFTQRLNSAGTPLWPLNGVRVTQANDNQSYVRLCPDGANGVIMTWEDRRKYPLTDVDVYAQRVSALGVVQWTVDGVPVCILPSAKSPPDLASDGAGGAVIVWMDPRSGTSQDMYAQRLNGSGIPQWTADGVSFSNATSSGRLYARIAPSGTGGVIVAWSDYRNGTDWNIYAQGFDALTGP